MKNLTVEEEMEIYERELLEAQSKEYRLIPYCWAFFAEHLAATAIMIRDAETDEDRHEIAMRLSCADFAWNHYTNLCEEVRAAEDKVWDASP